MVCSAFRGSLDSGGSPPIPPIMGGVICVEIGFVDSELRVRTLPLIWGSWGGMLGTFASRPDVAGERFGLMDAGVRVPDHRYQIIRGVPAGDPFPAIVPRHSDHI